MKAVGLVPYAAALLAVGQGPKGTNGMLSKNTTSYIHTDVIS